MSAAENKAIVRRFVEEAQGRGNDQVIEELAERTFINRTPPPGLPTGREGVQATFALFRTAVPDMTVVIHDQLAEGDTVVTRKPFQGRRQGAVMGIPLMGKRVSIDVIDILRLQDGQIVEHWGQTDRLGLMQQRGVVPAAGQAGEARPAAGRRGEHGAR